MKLDDYLDRSETHHAPHMGREIDGTVPREEWPVEAPDRNAVEARVGERDRLNDHRGKTFPDLGGAEQRAFKRKHPIAVSARPLRKEDQCIASGEPVADRVALGGGAAHSTVDKDAALQFGEPAEERPIRHLGFGDKGTGDHRAEDRDIGV